MDMVNKLSKRILTFLEKFSLNKLLITALFVKASCKASLSLYCQVRLFYLEFLNNFFSKICLFLLSLISILRYLILYKAKTLSVHVFIGHKTQI